MNPKITDWRGRRVWLVGASSGIGAALAQALHRRGAVLALSARRAETLEALKLPGALCLPCDATRQDSLEAARDQVLVAWGGLDMVIYLAGDYVPMTVDDFDLAKARRVLAVNFDGALGLTGAVLPHLVPGGGLALVASVAGYRGLPKALCYGPGKAALIHLAECLHLELAPRGVGVWVVNPGFVATRLTDQNDFHMPALMTPPQAAEALIAGFARGRFEIRFPAGFTRVMKLLAQLPYGWYFPLIRRITGGRHEP